MPVSQSASPPGSTKSRRWSLPGAAIIAGAVLCTSLLAGGVSSASLAPVVDDSGVICSTPVRSDSLWTEFDRLDAPPAAGPAGPAGPADPADPAGDCGSCPSATITDPATPTTPAPLVTAVPTSTIPSVDTADTAVVADVDAAIARPIATSIDAPVVHSLAEAGKADEDPKGVAAVTWTVDDKLTRAFGATEWGLTQMLRTTLDITAFCKGEVWKNVVSTADGLVHTKSRLLPGVVEVTAALVNAEKDCGTLSRMATSLKDAADGKAHLGYYMLAAVEAHENLHVTHYKAGVNPAFATFKAAVEALTIPKGDAKDAAAAATKIKALPAYTAALTAFRAAETKAGADTAAHKPAGDFAKAEHAVVDPMIKTITDRRTALKCP
jgi:hypothetical protein